MRITVTRASHTVFTAVLLASQVAGYGQTPIRDEVLKLYVPLTAEQVHDSVFKFHGTPIQIHEDGEVARLPMTIVFVIDRAKHQAPMLPLVRKYVRQVTSRLSDADVRWALVLTGATSQAQTYSAADFLTRIDRDIASEKMPNRGAKSSLADSVRSAIQLARTATVGAIVVVSDGDDDIGGKSAHEISLLLAKTDVRLFSLLLAFHDFYGTKAHSQWGWELGKIAEQTAGGQYETNYQARDRDERVLNDLAARIRFGTIVSVPSILVQSAVRSPVALEIRTPGGAKQRTAQFIP